MDQSAASFLDLARFAATPLATDLVRMSKVLILLLRNRTQATR